MMAAVLKKMNTVKAKSLMRSLGPKPIFGRVTTSGTVLSVSSGILFTNRKPGLNVRPNPNKSTQPFETETHATPDKTPHKGPEVLCDNTRQFL